MNTTGYETCGNGYFQKLDEETYDTIWNYVNDFLSGRINRKQFWALAEFKYPTHQISFHTLSVLDCLKFVRSEVVYG